MNVNKTYLVIGLGITGLSVVEYLLQQGASVTVTDSRAAPPSLGLLNSNFPQVPVLLGGITIPDNISDIILSPGVALEDPALIPAHARNIPIIGDIELFAQVVDKPVLAITGSNGKSTVTTLLGLMATESGLNSGVGGNLGTPALALLNPDRDCYILELSSFQLETLYSLRPLVATVLNISPDHMDRYEDLRAYAQAKLRIYNHAQNAVINRADDLTKVPPNTDIPSVSFGIDQPSANDYGVINHKAQLYLAKGNTALMAVNDLAMLGEHNLANALTALAMGEISGFKREAMLEVLKSFKGLEHRCEKIVTAHNIVWVNDSKGTNVAATVAALEGLGKSIVGKWLIILGGIGKNADFTPLIAPLQKYCRAAILIGQDQQQLWDILHTTTVCYKAVDLAESVDYAYKNAIAGDGVLLSPACASLDMFDNYMHRGNVFKQQVLQRVSQQDATTTTV